MSGCSHKATMAGAAYLSVSGDRMTQVGDQVTVKITGAPGTGTSLGPGAIKIGPGANMTVPGTIIEDRGDYWVVELKLSIRGKNRILVAKTSVE